MRADTEPGAEDPRKGSKKDWQVRRKAQKVTSREPPLTWPGVT